ncbi:MAG: hypothetical protein ICV87_13955 [Gemmatimonadetes bacterium]|nr:hypothetical protein [Gemmatimonadota bacterium]
MIDDREAAEKEARGADVRRWVVVLGVCLVWQLAGAALVVFAFHAHMDHDDALEIVWGGFGLAAAGTLLTIALGAPRREREE